MEQINQALLTSLSETLENMAFMEVLPVEDQSAEFPQDQESAAASLLIHDPIQGEMLLVAPKPLLGEVCGSVFALPEEEISEQLLHDTLAELLNTIAGRLLKELLPEDQTFQLGLPQPHSGLENEVLPPLKKWIFEVNEQPLQVILSGEPFMQSLAAN